MSSLAEDLCASLRSMTGPEGTVLGRAVMELTREFEAARESPEVRAFIREAGNNSDPQVLTKLITAIAGTGLARSSAKVRVERTGSLRFAAILEQHGGTLSAKEVGELVGGERALTPDYIRKRRAKNELLAVNFGGRQRYPRWQFHNHGVLPGFREILALLKTDSDVAKVRFFLTPAAELNGQSPLEALQKNIQREMVERLARQFGEQGAR